MSELISTKNIWLLDWPAVKCSESLKKKKNNRIASAHGRFCQKMHLSNDLNHSSLCPYDDWMEVLLYLTKTQYKIWESIGLCSLKTDDLFITNRRQIFLWIIFPINRFHSINLILQTPVSQICRHLFKCGICRIRNGMTIALWFFVMNKANSIVTHITFPIKHNVFSCIL